MYMSNSSSHLFIDYILDKKQYSILQMALQSSSRQHLINKKSWKTPNMATNAEKSLAPGVCLVVFPEYYNFRNLDYFWVLSNLFAIVLRGLERLKAKASAISWIDFASNL